MKKTKTIRGFGYIEFEDTCGMKCSIQESSVDSNLWLGCNNAPIKVMYEGRMGWHDFVFPPQVKEKLITNRMHLDKKLAKKLIKQLQKFVDTGGL